MDKINSDSPAKSCNIVCALNIFLFFKHLGIFLDIAADIIFELVPTEKINQITLSDYFL